MEVVYALLFLGAMGGIYALFYTMNHRTAVPEGCEDLKVECEGCKIISCSSHPTQQMDKGEVNHD